ncbi:MAG: hypothetical protein H7328_11115 [Bdellovibrio sp.]|nr:hypothetical protein [Bdellovibrio sp.]
MNFKQLLGALVLTFSGLIAIAQTETLHHRPQPGPNSVMGDWHALNRIGNPDTEFQVDFNFSPYQATIKVTCFFHDGAVLGAVTTSAAAYGFSNAYDIFIQNGSQVVASDGFRFCRATLQPTRWTAYFNGYGQMQLITQVPFQSQFNLVRN